LKIGIHQPNFFPHPGYFDKMKMCDIFVMLDDVNFSKGGYTNRTKLTPEKYLTLPCLYNSHTHICDVKIHNPEKNLGKLKNTIKLQYKSAYSILENVFNYNHFKLSSFNTHSIDLAYMVYWANHDKISKSKTIPDYTFDFHTYKGKKMGSGVEHFYKEGAKINNNANIEGEKEFEKLALEIEIELLKNPKKEKIDKPKLPTTGNLFSD